MSTTVMTNFQNLSLERLHESSTNPRRTFDEAKLNELAESIRSQGLVQPIVARPNADGFEIVAGARRFRAAKLAQVQEIPVRIVELSDEQALEWQLIENSQRQDVHPYEEALGYQRLLQIPSYDVATLAAKTGKSESHLYARLKLLNLIDEVAAAFIEDRIAASHAVLIARLPRERQAEAFEHCWRKDWQDSERHLLPAKSLSEWLENNVYLNLAEARFDTEDTGLLAEAGTCSACPKHSGFNTRLFSDVQEDVCLDGACWNAKLSASLDRAIEQRPDLVQIDTGWTAPKDRKAGVLDRSSYQVITSAVAEEEEAAEACTSAKDALIVQGPAVGSIVRVCADPECAIHGQPQNTAEQEERNRQLELQRQKQERIRKQRTELFERIIEAAPPTLTAAHWKLVLRAIVSADLYSICDNLATQYQPEPVPDDQRGAEEVLLEVLLTADEKALNAFALRFALTEHISEPHDEEQTDYLKEAAQVFGAEDTPLRRGRRQKRPMQGSPNRPAAEGKPLDLFVIREGEAARSGRPHSEPRPVI
jgi:ParB family transcriptional regulator, chromosome partitioning protein